MRATCLSIPRPRGLSAISRGPVLLERLLLPEETALNGAWLLAFQLQVQPLCGLPRATTICVRASSLPKSCWGLSSLALGQRTVDEARPSRESVLDKVVILAWLLPTLPTPDHLQARALTLKIEAASNPSEDSGKPGWVPGWGGVWGAGQGGFRHTPGSCLSLTKTCHSSGLFRRAFPSVSVPKQYAGIVDRQTSNFIKKKAAQSGSS